MKWGVTVHSHNMKPLILNISVKLHTDISYKRELRVINHFSNISRADN